MEHNLYAPSRVIESSGGAMPVCSSCRRRETFLPLCPQLPLFSHRRARA